jgi:hypothetical protein
MGSYKQLNQAQGYPIGILKSGKKPERDML